MRAAAAFVFDVRFQWRHGFYFVYMIVCAIYWALLHFIPEPYLEKATVLLTFSDPSALGLILAGGIVLLERDQGIHDPLFITPIRIREYLVAKAASLALISLLAAWVIQLSSIGIPASPMIFSIGIVLTSSFMTLLSIGVAARYRTINSFILMSQVYVMPFILPLLDYLEVWESKLFLLLPTEGTLMLLLSVSFSLTSMNILYALCILSIWNYAVYKWAYRSYERHILNRIGKGAL
ncbi:ABC transporter permease [Fontibacillus sp. BL9]|uniref:fluoroquinolone export ABC transporter permease subunit n=1 Tax=Fontibacillus sp. BL9 TaxID=3389971 RepID=UPI0039795FF4